MLQAVVVIASVSQPAASGMCDRWTSGDMRKMHIRRMFPAFRKAAAEGLVPTFHRHQVQHAKMEFLAHSSHRAQQVGYRPKDGSVSLTRGYSTNSYFHWVLDFNLTQREASHSQVFRAISPS